MALKFVSKLVMVADAAQQLTGRIYPRDELVKLAEAHAGQDIYGTFVGVDVDDASKHAIKASNLRMVANSLVCDFELLATPNGHALQNMLDIIPMVLAPRGRGKVAADGTVSEYDLISIDVKLA